MSTPPSGPPAPPRCDLTRARSALSPQVPGLRAAGVGHHTCDGYAQRRCATPARPPPALPRLPPRPPLPPARHSCAAAHPPVLPARRPARSACQHHTIRLRVAASSVEMGAKKKPKKKPVKKQACRPPHRPAPPTPVTTLRPIPDPHVRSPSLCTSVTPGEGAERRQRALLPRGHQGLHRRPQRLRLQDRPLELEPHQHGVACRMVAALSGLRAARDRTLSSRVARP